MLNICQIALCTLISCSLASVIFDDTRIYMTISFVHWKGCLFFKKLCFQPAFRCCRNDLVTVTVIVKIPCGPLQTISWGFSHSIMREEIGQNLFFTRKTAFFLKNLCFQQPLRCYRNGLVTSTVFFRIPCGPL